MLAGTPVLRVLRMFTTVGARTRPPASQKMRQFDSHCGKRARACESGSSKIAVCPILCCSNLRSCKVKRPEISSKVHLKTLLCFQYLGAVISRCSGLNSCCGKRAQACESGSSKIAVCPVLRCSGLRNC